MYTSVRTIQEKNMRIFHTAIGCSDSFHLIDFDMQKLTECHDALVVYMAILWNKQDTIRWKPKRFNAALDWMVENKIINPAIRDRYIRSDKNA